MSLAQIGEFSFIIAQLGLSLKVTSDFLYPVAVAVSAVTTFTTPYMIRLSAPMYEKLAGVLPHRWKTSLNRYSAAAQTISVVSDWKQLLRSYFMNMVIYFVVILSIILLSYYYLLPLINIQIDGYNYGRIVSAIITLVLLLPFLWALAFRKVSNEASSHIWEQKKYRGPLLLLRLSRIVLSVILIGFFIDQFFSYTIAVLVTVVILLLVFMLRHRIQQFYNTIEERFFSNFNARDARVGNINKSVLAPWDAHLAVVEIHAHSPVTGKTLQELALREQYGVNIALVNRGGRKLYAPDKDTRLYPGDVITSIGTDEQLEKFNLFLESSNEVDTSLEDTDPIALRQFLIGKQSRLAGRNIREAGIRERTRGIVLGIERKGQRLLNPESNTVLEAGDIVWTAGSGKMLNAFIKEQQQK
jgi:CPA2 family monovalent cation:H+ antiporter-2